MSTKVTGGGIMEIPLPTTLTGADGGVAEVDSNGNVSVAADQMDRLLHAVEELITIQKGMLKLLEAAFEDGLSGRQDTEIDQDVTD